jgi:non-ribosomal peptide synthetase component F
LRLSLWETPDGLHGWFAYNTDLFDAATITRMIGHFETLLHGIAAQPDAPLSALREMLNEADRQEQVRKEEELEEVSLDKLRKVKRRAIDGSQSRGDSGLWKTQNP